MAKGVLCWVGILAGTENVIDKQFTIYQQKNIKNERVFKNHADFMEGTVFSEKQPKSGR